MSFNPYWDMLKSSFYSVVIYILFSSVVFAEESYEPPKMFSSSPHLVVKEKVFIPSRKPSYRPIEPIDKTKKIETSSKPLGEAFGVSKSVVSARPASAPSVETKSLMLSSAIEIPKVANENSSSIETSIAFLPFAVDLTKTQKIKFKNIIQTYFIERDAKSVVVKVYASDVEGEKQNSAKRKALSRALSVRDWLLDLGVEAEQITLKAIGKSHDKGLPDRADIAIIF